MRWPRYEQMKASGVAWLGEVPGHCDVKPLKHAIRFQRGHDLPAEERQVGEVPVVSSAGYAAWHDVAIASAPGITTGRYGTVGQFTYVTEPYWPLNTVLYSIASSGNNLRYLWWMLHLLEPLFVLNSQKSAVPGVDRNDLHPVPIALPPLNEQRAIAAFLDRETARIDALVAAKRRLIALLQEKRAALITRAVTRGLDPEVPTKDSGVAWLGSVPAHWHVTPLKRVTSLIRSGKTPLGGATVYEDEGVPFLRSQNVHFSGLELSDVAFIDIDTHRSMRSSSVLPHDVLLNITGASVGRVCVVPASMQHANVNQHVCIIRLKRDVALSEFVATVLQSPGIQAQIRADETGSSREGLTFSQIGDFAIALPPLEEQRSVVKSMSRELARLAQSTEIAEQTMRRLTEYRSSLITSAVTGRIDVRAAT